MSKDWKTPPGLTQGTWDYVRAGQIASGYDRFLKDDRLAEFDTELLDKLFPTPRGNDSPPVVVDFGAGTGRSLLPLIEKGYCGIAVDLSENMLKELQKKLTANTENRGHDRPGERQLLEAICLQANLTELAGIASGIAESGLCMFSTIGMIKSKKMRSRFLVEARRIIKLGGTFVVHVHNYWFQLRHPGGVQWMISNGIQSLRGKAEIGDRYSDYRGVKQMFIHSFRRREIESLLNQSDFNIRDVIPFKDESRSGWLSDIGWFFVCK